MITREGRNMLDEWHAERQISALIGEPAHGFWQLGQHEIAVFEA
jgi:hypothetical protein